MITKKRRIIKRVEAYGYAVARLRARLSGFLKRSDYETMLKMGSTREILRFISSSTLYGRFLGSLEGLDLMEVEKGLTRAYYSLFDDVRRMLKPDVRFFLDAVHRKFELETLRSLIRAKAASLPPSEALKVIVPVGRYTREFCEELLRAKDLVRLISMVEDKMLERNLLAAVKEYERIKSPLPLEAAVDRYNYSMLFSEADKLSGLDRRWISMFLGMEVDVKNMVSIIRGREQGLTADQINELALIPHYYNLNPGIVVKAASAPNLQVAIQTLALTRYGVALSKAEPTLLSVEVSLTNYLLNEYRRVFLYYPFHVGFIYAFLNLAFYEVSDIRALLIGKAEGLPADAIVEHLSLYR
ncbi:MAG: V-type ATPase subunit [Candidatus Nezhaarchaeales archaeon]